MGNGGAKSPALGRDRSNKLKEVLDGVDGRRERVSRQPEEGRDGAGWKTPVGTGMLQITAFAASS